MQAQQRFAQLVLPVAIAVALPAFATQAALAADASDAPPATAATATTTASASASPADAPTAADQKDAKDATFGVAMSSDQLDEHRGGDALISNMNLTGSVAGNLASHVVTGTNTVDGGSFANASGLPTVIQNTGANVLIQNATILNVRFGD